MKIMSRNILFILFAICSVSIADVLTVQSYTANPVAWYGDEDTGGIELTDGVKPSYDVYNAGWSSYDISSQDLEIIFTFNASQALGSIDLHYLNYSTWSVIAPASVTYSFSTDGVNFTGAVTKNSGFVTNDGIGTASVATPGVTCGYVKAVIHAAGWVKLGEFTFNAPSNNPISYVMTPEPESGTPDTSGEELADGEMPTDWYSEGWVGYNTSSSNVVITFDMSVPHQLSSIGLHYMAYSGWTLGSPAAVTFTFSNDGINFTNPVTYTAFDSSDGVHTTYVDVLGAVSRYVKAEITASGPWLRLGEVAFADKGEIVYTAIPAASSSAPDSGGELTDGFAPISDIYNAGWSEYNITDGNLVITFNLNDSVDLSSINLAYMVNDGWSAYAPASVTYSFSNDGVNYSNPLTITNLDNSNWEHTAVANIPGGITTKYVKAELKPNALGAWMRLSEFTFVERGEISYTTSTTPVYWTPDNNHNLANGILPSGPYDADWLLYNAVNLDVIMNLNDTITLSDIGIHYYVLALWNQKPPQSVQLTFSTDGVNFANPVTWSVFDNTDGAHTTKISVPDVTCQYVKITLTAPSASAWHRLGEFLFYQSGVNYDNVPKAVAAGMQRYDDPYNLLVVFDHPVSAASAQNLDNYELAGNLIAGAEVWDKASNCVKVSVAIPLESDGSYALRYKNIEGLGGEKITYWAQTNTFAPATIDEEAQKLLVKQLPDGAFNMVTPLNGTSFQDGDNNIWIEPSFALHAAQAMLMANEVSPNSTYLASVNNFLHWYVAHLETNGTIYVYTGSYPNYNSSGNYDSTDAYAAQFIETAYMYYQQTQDAAFLDWVWPYVIQVAGAMDLTLQSDGLTWATPTSHVKYLMDNSEVYIGYKAAEKFATLKSNSVKQTEWSTKAANCLAGIETMYLGDGLGRYASAKMSDGSLNTSWEVAYPDGDSQMAVIRNVLLETNIAKVSKVWNASVQNFVPNHVPNDDLVSAWWVLGGIGVGEGDQGDTDICFIAMQKGNLAWKNYLMPDYQNIMVMHKQIMQQRMGDLNIDGRINFEDFAQVSENWNGSDIEDLATLADNWLQIDIWWN
ncbi:MAG: hypothetical protein A2Y12_08520 [Planctomycetes bacterium GWF2_42_9]|nr:MAG: hypothetical protein A2Y12_08520 [Planctomycetes bacterium GWF2_42_9]